MSTSSTPSGAPRHTGADSRRTHRSDAGTAHGSGATATLPAGSGAARAELPARHRAAAPRPAFSMGALWVAGFTAAGVAVLIILGITLLVRSFLNLAVFENFPSTGDGGIGPLSLGVIIAMLLATALIGVLLRVSDRPGQIYAAVVALAWIAFVVVALTTGDRNPAQRFGEVLCSVLFAGVFLALGQWVARSAVGWAR